MSDEPQKPEQPSEKPDKAPDGRGPRPTDPNELAKWIVEQTADEESQKNGDG